MCVCVLFIVFLICNWHLARWWKNILRKILENNVTGQKGTYLSKCLNSSFVGFHSFFYSLSFLSWCQMRYPVENFKYKISITNYFVSPLKSQEPDEMVEFKKKKRILIYEWRLKSSQPDEETCPYLLQFAFVGFSSFFYLLSF